MDSRRQTIIAMLFVLFFLVGGIIVIYFELYLVQIEWNNTAVSALCNVTNHVLYERMCTKACNCQGSMAKACDTCNYPCFDGFLELEHFNKYASVSVYDSRIDKNILQKDLNENYPINVATHCYYNSENDSQMRLTLADSGKSVAIMIFLSCCAFIDILCILFGVAYNLSYKNGEIV